MFAVNHLLFSKPVDEFRLVVEQEGLPLLSGYQGFRDFYFVKVAEDKVIIIILLQDAASAEAGEKSFGPTWFAENFKQFLIS